MKKTIFTIIVSVAVVGCGVRIDSPVSHASGRERVVEKNYEIGQRYVAYVGQPMVKVKDYIVYKEMKPAVKASRDFEVTTGRLTITGKKGDVLDISGIATIKGKKYFTVRLSKEPPTSYFDPKFLISEEDGSVYPKLMNVNVISIHDIRVTPPDMQFDRIYEVKADPTGGYTNYELVYGGTDGKSITITYREFTPDNMARPAFFQNVVYDSNQPKIRFRNTEIIVHKANNEKIEYTVVADGL